MNTIKLSELLRQIQDEIQAKFGREIYTITAQIVDVKKRTTGSKWCTFRFVEKDGWKTTEIKGLFLSENYKQVEIFEDLTKKEFKDGIEISCQVRVRFHSIFGLELSVLKIDLAHTLGRIELERQQKLKKLLKENPNTIRLIDGVYKTFNNSLPIPLIVENIALITANSSEGQRDFLQEIKKNRHGFTINVIEFLVAIQGDTAHEQIIERLNQIEKEKEKFDVVAIVRGGGSTTDFKPFENYELANRVANFPIPIFTGIGHDRNTSIVDMMAREQKTPTKVAALFVEHNYEFENKLVDLKTRLASILKNQLDNANNKLAYAKRIVKLSSPQAILNRGFAIITSNNKIVTDPKFIKANSQLQTLLRNEVIHSTVTKKTKNEKRVIIQ